MATQPYVLPDLRTLSPEDRKIARQKYKASLPKTFVNTKTAVASRKSAFSDRAAVRIGLVNAGGINGDDEIDEVALLLHSKWASVGENASLEDALNRLATDPAVLAESIAEYREAFPANFVDISHAERMPATSNFQKVKQFQAKTQIINQHAKNLAGGERRQAPMIARAEARDVQPEVPHRPMPI